MSEHQLFCWSKDIRDSLSARQNPWRVFNKNVTQIRYGEIRALVQQIIPNSNKINLHSFWESLTNKQILELSQIPEFDPAGFTYITGRAIPNKTSLSGKKVEVIIDGEKFSATID